MKWKRSIVCTPHNLIRRFVDYCYYYNTKQNAIVINTSPNFTSNQNVRDICVQCLIRKRALRKLSMYCHKCHFHGNCVCVCAIGKMVHGNTWKWSYNWKWWIYTRKIVSLLSKSKKCSLQWLSMLRVAFVCYSLDRSICCGSEECMVFTTVFFMVWHFSKSAISFIES